MSPAVVDKNQGAGTAARFGYTDGYEATYDALDTSETIDTSVLQFASVGQAQAFVPTALDAASTPEEKPRTQSYAPIAGGLELTPTKATSDGFYDYVVVAAKGSRLMIFDYINDQASGIPAPIASLVADQYRKI